METIGEILKNKRFEKGLTLEDASNLTKIRKKYLEALENGNYDEIPEKVYVKSFLKIYSDFLELDRAYILKRYQDEISPEESVIITPTYCTPVNDKILKSQVRNRRFLYIIAGVIGIALIIWGVNRVKLEWFESSPQSLSETEPTEVTLPPLEMKPIEKSPLIIHNYDKLMLRIDCIAYTWISKSIDGKGTISYIMLPNKSEFFEAQKRSTLRIGNASGVRINVNGFNLGDLGKSGEVIDLRISLNSKKSVEIEIERENGSIEKKILKD